MLLELLEEVVLVEELFERELGLVEDGVDGRDVGVAAKTSRTWWRIARERRSLMPRRRPGDAGARQRERGVGREATSWRPGIRKTRPRMSMVLTGGGGGGGVGYLALACVPGVLRAGPVRFAECRYANADAARGRKEGYLVESSIWRRATRSVSRRAELMMQEQPWRRGGRETWRSSHVKKAERRNTRCLWPRLGSREKKGEAGRGNGRGQRCLEAGFFAKAPAAAAAAAAGNTTTQAPWDPKGRGGAGGQWGQTHR